MRISDTEDSISLSETLDATPSGEGIAPRPERGNLSRVREAGHENARCQSGDSLSAARSQVDLDQAALANERKLARMQLSAVLRAHATPPGRVRADAVYGPGEMFPGDALGTVGSNRDDS